MQRSRSAHGIRLPSVGVAHVLAGSFVIGTFALIGCGPSFQALYEGDARFEHCYALEEDGVQSIQKRADCWRDWTDHYTFGQTRDRVQYASMRYRALTSTALPTDEGMMSAAPGEANPGGVATALAPTNAFAPPPTTASATPGSSSNPTWMTAPSDSSNSGGSWMSTAPTNMLPNATDAGPHSGPVPSASPHAPTAASPNKKN